MNIRIEDLEINNYKIYQDKDSFNFGIDAVFLANFALQNIDAASYVRPDTVMRVCDLCTGNLPIPLIMYAKRKEFVPCKLTIDAIEINKEQVKIANDSLNYNYENVEDAKNILDDIKIINEDIKNVTLDKKYKNESYDVITCNPPYMKKGSALVNENDEKMIARHEILITFDEICKTANYLLKSNKRFYIIHHSERFTELVETLKKYSFEVKKVQFIYPYIDKPSNLVLIEAVKNAKSAIKVLPPIIMYKH